MKKDKLLLDKIKKDIKKAKVVSFDIFDTLLVRPYIKPIDLFVHMEKAFERQGFAEERRDAERRARVRHKELEDITFDMIYEEIDDEFSEATDDEDNVPEVLPTISDKTTVDSLSTAADSSTEALNDDGNLKIDTSVDDDIVKELSDIIHEQASIRVIENENMIWVPKVLLSKPISLKYLKLLSLLF